jgi:hypothetical protein
LPLAETQKYLAAEKKGITKSSAPLEAIVVKPAPETLFTPTSKLRSAYKLWQRVDNLIEDSMVRKFEWKFVHFDDLHIVRLEEDLFLGLRTVTMNDIIVFAGVLQLGYWSMDAQLGSKTNGICSVRLEIKDLAHKGCVYELYVDDLPFDGARHLFLSKMASLNLLQRAKFDDKLTAQREKNYIRANWFKEEDKDRTSLGFTKSRITWRFTVNGVKHVIVLQHSHSGGKYKINVDGFDKFEKKSVLSRSKPFKWDFDVGATLVTVLVKLRETPVSNNSANSMAEKASDKARSKENKQDKSYEMFDYELLIDGVPFVDNTLAEIDRAGGSINDPASPKHNQRSAADLNNKLDQLSINPSANRDKAFLSADIVETASPQSAMASPRSVNLAGFRSAVFFEEDEDDFALVGENMASDD